MRIRHEFVAGTEDLIYIHVNIVDKYEFGKETFGKGQEANITSEIKQYAKKNLKDKKNSIAIIIVNGVLIGSISIAGLLISDSSMKNIKSNTNSIVPNNIVSIYKEGQNETGETTKENQVEEESKEEQVTPSDVIVDKKTESKVTSNKTIVETKSTPSKVTTKAPTKPAPKKTSPTSAPTPTPTPTPTQPAATGTTIKLNTGGTVVTMNLEEYIVGVVAAEMPASFHTEALKAQAVAARTFAMKKKSQGITLINSTTHQVYKTESQMKSLWGSSFNTYYNKIKNAVAATKGLVMMHSGSYIDALYHSMSNGKTEKASYVWSYDKPYLQCVSSSWDVNVKNFKVSTKINYDVLSNKLGQVIDRNTEIKIVSETVSGRINKVQIGNKTYTGVNVRTLLGLRSTDFIIDKYDTYVIITTKGYGHGVGMSQYGANEAAKSGYTFRQILNHYYTNIQIIQK